MRVAGTEAILNFLAGNLVVNLVVGCHYFLPGLQLPSQSIMLLDYGEYV